jgi:hypothetical protein
MADNGGIDPREALNLPWPMFAVELNGCKSNIAIAMSSTNYLQARASDAEKTLGVTPGSLMRLTDIIASSNTPASQTTLALIPSPATCEAAVDSMLDIAVQKADKLKNPNIRNEFRAAMGSIPYPLWSDIGDDVPTTEEVVNLMLFVVSDNVERKQTYAPPNEPKSTQSRKKRKRCEAHLYEMGIAWSDAYSAYQKAMRSDPQGGHVRPHTRRGHFHRFRVGPRDGEVKYVTHWLPPTLIGDPTKAKPQNQGHRYR